MSQPIVLAFSSRKMQRSPSRQSIRPGRAYARGLAAFTISRFDSTRGLGSWVKLPVISKSHGE